MQREKVQADTIIRTIVLALTMINQVLVFSGKNPLPFADTEVYEFLSLAASICAGLWNWWKNNSFTSAAIKADRYMTKLKEDSKK